MDTRFSFFFLLLFLLGSLSVIHATDYKVQVLVPTSSASESEETVQWISVMKLAADRVNAQPAWSTGPHRLLVEILDYNDNPTTAVMKTIDAGQDASVLAIVQSGEEELAETTTLVANSFGLPHLVPHLQGTGLDTTDLLYFSLRPNLTFGPSTLNSLLSYYHWDKVGLVYAQDDPDSDIPLIREQLLSIQNVEFISIPVAPTAPTFYDIGETIIRRNINVVVIVTTDESILKRLLEDFRTARLLLGDRAFIYYNHEGAGHLNLTQGVLSIHEVATTTDKLEDFKAIVESVNPTTYPGLGSGMELDDLSLYFFESINVIAQTITNIGVGSNILRADFANAIKTVVYSGWVGEVSFLPNGYRERGNSEVLSYRGDISGGNDVVFHYNGTLEAKMTPLWPGRTSLVPSVEIEILPLPIIAPYNVGVSDAINVLTRRLLRYSVERLNNGSYLPPNYKFMMYNLDHAKSSSLAVRYSLNATRIGAVGVIGSTTSSMTTVIQDVVSAWNIPQISPGAQDPDLSDRDRYPTFMRISSSSIYQANAFIELAKRFGWTEWSIIAAETDITPYLLEASLREGITVVNQLFLDPSSNNVLEPIAVFAKTRPRVLVILSDSENISAIAWAMAQVSMKPLAVIVNDALVFLDIAVYTSFLNISRGFFDGWLTLGMPSGSGPVSDQVDAELRSLNSTNELYTGIWELYNRVPLFNAFFEAAHVFADAIMRCVMNGSNPRDGLTLLHYLGETDLDGITGRVKFDGADRSTVYEIRNIIVAKQESIGRWTKESGLQIEQVIIWPDGTTNVPSATIPRDLEWLKWNSGAGIVLALLASLGLAFCVFTAVVVYHQRLSPVIMSSTWQFLILMIIGAMVGFGSVFVWIGIPKDYLCGLRIWLPPLGFILITSPLLAKTWRLHRIFTLSNMRITPIPLSRLVLMVVAAILVQLIICVFWVAFGSLHTVVQNNPDDKTVAYVVCSSNTAYRICTYVTYAYLGLLIVTCSYLAFRVRKLPRDFNESRWIAVAVYNILIFSAVIIIIGYALKKFIVIVLILICVCTLAISFGSVAIMMLPKLWELYQHPERRSSSSENSTKLRNTTSRTTPPSKTEATPPSTPVTGRKRTDYSVGSKSSKSAADTSSTDSVPGTPSYTTGLGNGSQTPPSGRHNNSNEKR